MATGKLIPIGNFGLADDTDMNGGCRAVADVPARDAIPTERRKAGMLVSVASNATIYTLGAGLGNGDWVLFSPGVSTIPSSDEASTTYTFQLVDVGARKRFTAGTAVMATVPPISSVAWLPGHVLYGVQLGAGSVTLAPGAGVTINVPSAFALQVLGQYAQFSLVHEGSDVWTLGGTLAFA